MAVLAWPLPAPAWMAPVAGTTPRTPSPPHSCLNASATFVYRLSVPPRTSSPTLNIGRTLQVCLPDARLLSRIAPGPACWCYPTGHRSRQLHDQGGCLGPPLVVLSALAILLRGGLVLFLGELDRVNPGSTP